MRVFLAILVPSIVPAEFLFLFPPRPEVLLSLLGNGTFIFFGPILWIACFSMIFTVRPAGGFFPLE